MANTRYVTSLAKPYFCFAADNVGDVSNLPGFGLTEVALEFRVDALPYKYASNNEVHPMVSLLPSGFSTVPPFEFGITPNGAGVASFSTGHSWSTQDGYFNNPSQWNTLVLSYDGGTGDIRITLNGVPIEDSDPSPEYLLPAVGEYISAVFFNGRGGITKAGYSIKYLRLAFMGVAGSVTNFDTSYLEWNFTNGAVTSVPCVTYPEVSTNDSHMPYTPTAGAGIFNPVTASPWGAVPELGDTQYIKTAYRWSLITEYTEIPKPITKYVQVPA